MSDAVGVYMQQMFFMIEQYAFLADNYFRQGHAAKQREYLNKAFLIFKQMKSQVVGKHNLVLLLINTFHNVDVFLDHWQTEMRNIVFPEFAACGMVVGCGVADDKYSYSGLTTLHIAAFQGDLVQAQTLLKNDLQNLNAVDSEGFRPLHCAVLAGAVMIELLLWSGGSSLNVNAQSKAGLTALHVAAIYDAIEVIKILLKSPTIDVNAASKDGWTALHLAVSLRRKGIVGELLKVESLDVNAKMLSEITALHIAAKLDDKKLTAMLLGRGADVAASTEAGATAQVIAEDFNSIEALKQLEIFMEDSRHKTYTAELANSCSQNLTVAASTTANAVAAGENLIKSAETVYQALEIALEQKNFLSFKSILAQNILQLTDERAERLLFSAVELGSFEMAEYLIEELGLSPQLKNQQQKTLLCAAVAGGNFEIVKYLIVDQGVPDVVGTPENCPLCAAIEIDDLTMVKYFLDRGGVSAQKVPILLAAEKCSLPVFVCLLEHGATLDVKLNGLGVFECAAIAGNSEILRYLVNEKNFKLDTIISESGLNCLFQVARVGKLASIKFFVEEQCMSLLERGPRKGTILHEAAFNRNLAVIRYFVEEHGLDAKARDDRSYVPLFYAVQQNNLEAVKYFVSERKLGIHLKDIKCRSALHIAAMHGHLAVVRYFVEDQKANINVKDNDGLTPFFLCAEHGSNIEVLEFLADHGCDFSGLSAEKANVLHFVARLGNVKFIEMLIEEKGFDKHAEDAKGQTPLFYAALAGQFEAVKYFIDDDDSQKSSIVALLRNLDSSAEVGKNFQIVEFLLNWAFERNVELTEREANMLHFAASLGLVNIIKILVREKGIKTNTQDARGQIALFYAVRAGHPETVEYLVGTNVADLDLRDDENQTVYSVALESVVNGGSFRVLEILLKQKWGENLLFSAARLGNVEIIKYLIEKKGMKASSIEVNSPLFNAIRAGHLEAVQYFVETQNAELKVVYEVRDRRTAPYWRIASAYSELISTLRSSAANSSHFSVLEYLLNWESQKNGLTANGQTILHNAAFLGKTDVMRYLIEERKIDANVQDSEGQTPVFYAALAGQKETVECLVYTTIDVNIKDNNNQTVTLALSKHLDSLASNNCNHHKILELLLNWLCKINGWTVYKPSILHCAARLGYGEAVRYLLRKGCDVNNSDSQGQTPLFYAAQVGSYEACAEILAFKGVDVNARDSCKQTAIFAAVISDNINLVQLLVHHGAALNITDKSDQTPEIYARQRSVSISRFLQNFMH